MDRKKNIFIQEKFGPELAGMWTNLYTGDLFFINGLETGKFMRRFRQQFKSEFLQRLNINDYQVVTIPFMVWTAAFCQEK